MTTEIIEDDFRRRATAPSKPTAQPNLLHQMILGSLLDNKLLTLANNVSDLSCDRSAKRWLR